MSGPPITLPVCYRAGCDKLARPLRLPPPWGEQIVYCSLAHAALDALDDCTRRGVAWDSGWRPGWTMHVAEGFGLVTPPALSCNLAFDLIQRIIYHSPEWTALPHT